MRLCEVIYLALLAGGELDLLVSASFFGGGLDTY